MSGPPDAFRGHVDRTFAESDPAWPARREPPQGAPNIVLIVLDDVGYAHLGCYGSGIETPHMDRLAAGGLRFTNFHTTAMCSPTRASLLTGRNHHAVGMGSVIDSASGFPGSWGRLSKSAATLAQLLRDVGYGTVALGKWHLTPGIEQGAAGPFDHRPMAYGFEHFYGFLGGFTSQFHPELVVDNTTIDPPNEPGYHLSEDLVERAQGFIRSHRSGAPRRPFFVYLAFAACHSPLHAPPAFVAKYRGRFDHGWDAERDMVFNRQKAMGIAAPRTMLAPRNPDVPAWDELTSDERLVALRTQELFAAYLDHTDQEIGKMIDFLEESDLAEDTLVMLISDNGAEGSGGRCGRVGWIGESFGDSLATIDQAGTAGTFSQYASGWAQVGNTPLKLYKHNTYAGGIRDPLIVRWPKHIKDRGGLRRQYHHVTDVMPTILELLAIEPPRVYEGEPQMPLHGTSFAYTFAAADAPTRKVTQYYEMLGDRAIWHRGWTAVTHHVEGESFDDDHWGLYRSDEDFSEYNDLSAEEPAKKREMVDRWWVEAGRYQALPLDDRRAARTRDAAAEAARRHYIFYPNSPRWERPVSPVLEDVSHAIVAEVQIPAGGAEGVLLASGGRLGGYVLYVKDRRLHYEYNIRGREFQHIVSEAVVPSGRSALAFTFRRTGRAEGIGSLSIDGKPAGSRPIKTMGLQRPTESVYCGREGGTPAGSGYTLPFAFTGTIDRVHVGLFDADPPEPDDLVRLAVQED